MKIPSRARRRKYRSGFEANIAKQLAKAKPEYEKLRIPYVLEAVYVPDFVVNGIVIEVKGRFTSRDRRKHLAVKEQHPELDIRFVFLDAKRKINKGSKTTYGEWCTKHGFLWAEKKVPKEWLA